MKVFFNRSFVKFVMIGGIAALVNFVSRYYVYRMMDFKVALVLAYITGMLVAFILYKAFVFPSTKNSLAKSWSYFVMVNLIGICICWLVSVIFAYYILPIFGVEQRRFEIAHLIGIVAPMFTSFIGHKYFSFKD
jgi:putative flippase GtrA